MAVATAAHRVLKIASPDEGRPVHAGELRALIRMDQHPLLRLAPPYRHVQRLQHRIGGLPPLHRPAHHTAEIEIDHDSQIGKALPGADVGDVGHPGPGQPGNTVRTAALALIQQVVLQFAVAIDLAAVIPGLSDQLGLPAIFLGSLAPLPSIEAAGLDAQSPKDRSNPELVTMLGNKSVFHFASLAERSDHRSNTRWLS